MLKIQKKYFTIICLAILFSGCAIKSDVRDVRNLDTKGLNSVFVAQSDFSCEISSFINSIIIGRKGSEYIPVKVDEKRYKYWNAYGDISESDTLSMPKDTLMGVFISAAGAGYGYGFGFVLYPDGSFVFEEHPLGENYGNVILLRKKQSCTFKGEKLFKLINKGNKNEQY